MPSTYKAPEYPYVKPAELAAGGVARTQVAIVGAGPIGLAAAIDLAVHGVDFIIIDECHHLLAATYRQVYRTLCVLSFLIRFISLSVLLGSPPQRWST